MVYSDSNIPTSDQSYRVLKNAWYSSFMFSDEFMVEYCRRHGGNPDRDSEEFREPECDDPKAIALFDELGIAASSFRQGQLRSVLVPPGCTYYFRDGGGIRVFPDIDDNQTTNQIMEDLLQLARHSAHDVSVSTQTRQLLDSGLTFQKFRSDAYANMRAYQANHPVVDKP